MKRMTGYTATRWPGRTRRSRWSMSGLPHTGSPTSRRRSASPPGGARPRNTARDIRLPGRDGFEEVTVYDGDTLHAGFRGAGPMIVETALTTALVPPGFDLEVDEFGSLFLTDTGA